MGECIHGKLTGVLPEGEDPKIWTGVGAVEKRSGPDGGLLSVEEVASYLGLVPATVYRWCREGRLPCLKLGRSWRVRPEALEDFLRQSEAASPRLDKQLWAFMASMPAHVAVVDPTGEIVAVNDAWRAFARANGGDPGRVAEGANYLAVCDSARGDQSEFAAAFAEGLRAVLAGREQEFAMEYPCHSPTQRRWFVGSVRRFAADDVPLAAVSHDNVTDRRSLEERLERYGRE